MTETLIALAALVALVPAAYLYGLNRGWQQARRVRRRVSSTPPVLFDPRKPW